MKNNPQPLTESWETEFDNAFYFRDSGSYVKCYPELNLQQLTCLKLFISRLLSQAEARHREELEELKLDFREQLTRLED